MVVFVLLHSVLIFAGKFFLPMSREISSNINSFDFPVACYDIVANLNTESSPSSCILAVGVYKPTIKLFQDDTLKNEKHSIEELIRCQLISSYTNDKNTKIVSFCGLRADRSIEFHSNSGLIETIKMDNPTHDISYFNRELLVATSKRIESVDLFTGKQTTKIDSGSHKLSRDKKSGLLFSRNNIGLNIYDTRTDGDSIFHYECTEGFDSCGDKFSVISDENLTEMDMRNGKSLRKIDGEYKLVKYTNKGVTYCTNNTLTINEKETTHAETLPFKINSICPLGEVVYVVGETEKIHTYSLST